MSRQINIQKPFQGARAPERIGDPEVLLEALGATDHDRITLKLHEIIGLLWLPEDLDQEELHARLGRAVELYESLAPADGAEGMLAMQMVGTHHAAMECLRRANIPEQSFEGRDMSLKHATKLMALYERQMSALNKSRGKGQQKVTVEHVHVAAGGQAIVGTVQAAGAQSSKTAPEMLEEDKSLSPLETRRKHKAQT